MSHRDLTTNGQNADVLWVAFTGHRRNKVDPAALDHISSQVRTVLSTILRTTDRPVRLLTSLADGSDLAAAAAALDLGIPFECSIPFGVPEFRNDLTSDADRDEYDRLVHAADGIRHVAGAQTSPSNRNAAYVLVAEQLIQGAELLVAVWNGHDADGPGGTAETIVRARRRGIPVVWIHSTLPDTVSLITGPDQFESGEVGRLIHTALSRAKVTSGRLP